MSAHLLSANGPISISINAISNALEHFYFRKTRYQLFSIHTCARRITRFLEYCTTMCTLQHIEVLYNALMCVNVSSNSYIAIQLYSVCNARTNRNNMMIIIPI